MSAASGTPASTESCRCNWPLPATRCASATAGRRSGLAGSCRSTCQSADSRCGPRRQGDSAAPGHHGSGSKLSRVPVVCSFHSPRDTRCSRPCSSAVAAPEVARGRGDRDPAAGRWRGLPPAGARAVARLQAGLPGRSSIPSAAVAARQWRPGRVKAGPASAGSPGRSAPWRRHGCPGAAGSPHAAGSAGSGHDLATVRCPTSGPQRVWHRPASTSNCLSSRRSGWLRPLQFGRQALHGQAALVPAAGPRVGDGHAGRQRCVAGAAGQRGLGV